MSNETDLAANLRGLKAMEQSIKFQEEICSTPRGKESYELREHARALQKRGEQEKALVLFEKAASLFSPEDRSPAAAMAWYDLGRATEDRATGVRGENLRNAETLFRRSIACPGLARDPHRMGMVRDALASCLRTLAYEQVGEAKDEALAEATRLFEEAVGFGLSNGTLGSRMLCAFRTTWEIASPNRASSMRR